MRKVLLLTLALLAMLGAVTTSARRAEAATCHWGCGLCGAVCPCQTCLGRPPLCPCG